MQFLLCLFLLFCACDQKPQHQNTSLINHSNVLEVATSSDYPPFISSKDHKLVGFDVEILNQISKTLGKKVQMHDIDFQDLFKTVVSHKVDLAIAAITKTPLREKEVDFSIPYHRSVTVIITTLDSPIRHLEDLNDKAVGVESGSTYEAYAKYQLLKTYSNITILSYKRYPQLLEALHAKKCDAIITGYSEAYELQSNNPDLKVIPVENTDVQYAIAVPKGSPLLSEINAKLQELITNGDLRKLEEKFFRQVIQE